MKKITVFLFILAAISGGVYGGNDLASRGETAEPMQLVRDTYKKQHETWRLAEKKMEIFYLHYSVKATWADNGKTAPLISDIQVWMNKDQVHLKSDQMEMYQDQKEVFTVLPRQKVIYRSDNIRNLEREKRMNQLSLIRDTIFDLSKVILSEKLSGHETGADKKVVIALTEEGKKLFSIDQVTFYIHTAKQEIKRMKISYGTDPEGTLSNEMESAEFTFIEINRSYNKKSLRAPVASLVMKGKKLLPRYTAYKLVDNRHKKNKPEKLKTEEKS